MKTMRDANTTSGVSNAMARMRGIEKRNRNRRSYGLAMVYSRSTSDEIETDWNDRCKGKTTAKQSILRFFRYPFIHKSHIISSTRREPLTVTAHISG